ncbi:hypothetical protein FHX44_113206 [Pseudonocardia hierapolitana]|uniref:Uncharacterized protein n=1 Tax=Pseudonocardia hierapolitana TaxID=1128676 RepID=A0A561SR29_9PSEU|nr:hypothetical protein [Pseudonocardia hierapolitana]TWF77301.1 hypothetical protein FHX44_113206 [Pseudonocardia hierapolitana]
MSRKRPDPFDDDGVRVVDSQGRRLRGRTPVERAAIETARRMRKAGQKVGQVDPLPLADGLDLERVAMLAAHLRLVLAQVDAGRLDVTPTMRDRLEAATVALEVLHDEPAPIDLDRLEDGREGADRPHTHRAHASSDLPR